jgi:hypothetical protein
LSPNGVENGQHHDRYGGADEKESGLPGSLAKDEASGSQPLRVKERRLHPEKRGLFDVHPDVPRQPTGLNDERDTRSEKTDNQQGQEKMNYVSE